MRVECVFGKGGGRGGVGRRGVGRASLSLVRRELGVGSLERSSGSVLRVEWFGKGVQRGGRVRRGEGVEREGVGSGGVRSTVWECVES